jgi:hypothetical protein
MSGRRLLTVLCSESQLFGLHGAIHAALPPGTVPA